MVRRLLLLFFVAFSARAENLVVNPHFDQGISGWTKVPEPDTTAVWEKVDALASPHSGALALTMSVYAGGRSVQQCVPVTPGTVYEAGVKIMLDGDQSPAIANMIGLFYESATCQGSWITTAAVETDFVRNASNGRFTPVAQRVQAPANAHSILLGMLLTIPAPGGTATVHFDDVYFGPSGGCVPNDTVLCLNSGRFKVTGTYRAPDATAASPAHVVQQTNDSGYMWFFDADNIEVTLKVLAACPVNNRQWVFAAGMTDVEVNLQVTDTVTGAMQRYGNRAGKPFEVILDSNAFSCP